MSDSGWVDTKENIYSDSNGKAGIGTGTPQNLLHLKDSGTSTVLKIDSGESNNTRIWFGDNYSSNTFTFSDTDSDASPVKLYPGSFVLLQTESYFSRIYDNYIEGVKYEEETKKKLFRGRKGCYFEATLTGTETYLRYL